MSIPYEPTAPTRQQRVGKLTVKGNDSWATVCKPGLVAAAIADFDNGGQDALVKQRTGPTLYERP